MKALGYLPWILAAFLLVQRAPQIWRYFSLEGQAAPLANSFTALDGQVLTPAAPYTLIFWATWCGPCTFELSRVNKMIADGEIPAAKVIAVSIDDNPDSPRATAKERGYLFPIVWDRDSRLARALQVELTPSIFILGPDQKVSWATSGLSPTLGVRLRSALRGPE